MSNFKYLPPNHQTYGEDGYLVIQEDKPKHNSMRNFNEVRLLSEKEISGPGIVTSTSPQAPPLLTSFPRFAYMSIFLVSVEESCGFLNKTLGELQLPNKARARKFTSHNGNVKDPWELAVLFAERVSDSAS